MVMLTLVIRVVPPAPFWGDQDAFQRLLGQGVRMQFAGLISYGTSQLLNVYLFSKLAGSGIGTAYCRRFLAEGAKVMIADIGEAQAKRTAAQRAVENTPGESTPESQQLDAAAVYFLEDAGRGGGGRHRRGRLA